MSAAIDPVVSRKMWRTLEPYHGMIYFSPQATAAYADIGIDGRAGYFASRAAPMGAVPTEVVVATFYNFAPDVVRAAIPGAWMAASPEQITKVRLAAVDSTLREVLGDAIGGPDIAEAAELARIAAGACSPEGRPLYAGHASLDWPERPHLVLWHALTLLREYRGDGHIAALVVEGLDGCEALHTHGAAADSPVPLDLLQATRGWDDEAWAAAADRLAARGLLDGTGLTALGEEVRARVEDTTDRLALAPWRALGADACDRLRTLVRPHSRTIAGSGIFALGT
jgi:hypothetical protein